VTTLLKILNKPEKKLLGTNGLAYFVRLVGDKKKSPLTSQKSKNLVKSPLTTKSALNLLFPGLNCQEAQN
jgi:hypothetical protein